MMPGARSDRDIAFLEKDYELKVSYLSEHFARMWTRFNFFLVIETALSAVFFGITPSGAMPQKAGLIVAIGIVSSLCWYVFGAQDRYLVEVYRTQIARAGAKIAER
jgi:hypothetical protein